MYGSQKQPHNYGYDKFTMNDRSKGKRGSNDYRGGYDKRNNYVGE